MPDEEKKTSEMIKYEKETGKQAIWQGRVTDSFKKWQKGEKVYHKDKERINILVTDETKKRWQDFATNNNISTVSKLIRASVDFYMNTRLREFENFSHFLKEKLSSIIGFSQVLITEYKDEISWELLKKIKELILDQGLELEKSFDSLLEADEEGQTQYDILIIDDDYPTISLLNDYFNKKGYSCKDSRLGAEAIDILRTITPKVILLDIFLPDISGYKVLKMIKSDDKLKNIPVFFISALQEAEVRKKTKSLGAEGYFKKPFKMLEFNAIFKYLK